MNNNPQADKEARLKQLENRLHFLRQYMSNQYSQRSINKRACELINICRAEYDRLK